MLYGVFLLFVVYCNWICAYKTFCKRTFRLCGYAVICMYSSLRDLIEVLNESTKLQIGVIFIGAPRDHNLILPLEHTIHAAPLCWKFKDRYVNQCVACRNRAIQKILRTKEPIFGMCVNGVWEYMHPIIIGDDVAGIIFVGNILRDGVGMERICNILKSNGWESEAQKLFDTMAHNVAGDDCSRYAQLIDSYFRLLYMQSPVNERKHENTLMLDLKSFIDENYNGQLSLNMLSKTFHYSEKYLGRCFKRYTGSTFIAYITKKRIGDAVRMLVETEMSVSEIAIKSGFETISYFNKRFLQHMGVTPTEYRKMNRLVKNG